MAIVVGYADDVVDIIAPAADVIVAAVLAAVAAVVIMGLVIFVLILLIILSPDIEVNVRRPIYLLY